MPRALQSTLQFLVVRYCKETYPWKHHSVYCQQQQVLEVGWTRALRLATDVLREKTRGHGKSLFEHRSSYHSCSLLLQEKNTRNSKIFFGSYHHGNRSFFPLLKHKRV